MSMELRFASDVRTMFKPMIDSGDYWVMILPPEAHKIAVEVEHRYYMGPANEDFHIVLALFLGPCVMVAIVCAHKRHMSSKALRTILQQYRAVPRRGFDVGTGDILIPGSGGDDHKRSFPTI